MTIGTVLSDGSLGHGLGESSEIAIERGQEQVRAVRETHVGPDVGGGGPVHRPG